MERHQTGRRIEERILKLLSDRGWKGPEKPSLFEEQQPSCDRDFVRDGVNNTLLVCVDTSVKDISWNFSIVFTVYVLDKQNNGHQGIDTFRVCSFTSIRDPSRSEVEFLLHRKNSIETINDENEFIKQLNARLEIEETGQTDRFTRAHLSELGMLHWREMLKDRKIPEDDYIKLSYWPTWKLLQTVLIRENVLEYSEVERDEEELKSPSPKRRSLSPKRSPSPNKQQPSIKSIFWIYWNSQRIPYPARMALHHEIPNHRKSYVYFFGSKDVAVLVPSARVAWEKYSTTSKKRAPAIAEAMRYAGIN
jgi:hypothetical protein